MMMMMMIVVARNPLYRADTEMSKPGEKVNKIHIKRKKTG